MAKKVRISSGFSYFQLVSDTNAIHHPPFACTDSLLSDPQFRYATAWELFLTLFGLMFATISAFGIPWNVVAYGEFTTLLVDRTFLDRNQTSTRTYLIELFGGGRIL